MTKHQMQLPKMLTASGVHEAEIRKRFPDGFAFPGTAPEFDVPLVLLGFFNRSGSNLLGRRLQGLDGFSGFAEQLNHPVIRNVSARKDLASFPDYFRLVQARDAGAPGHIHGFKASWDQVLMLKRAGIDRMYQGLRLIHIVREDIIGQAISLVIAQQTQQWNSQQDAKAGVEPVYDASRISQAMQVCAEADMRMRMAAQILALPYLRVTYETLDETPAAVMTRVGAFLDRDLSGWEPEPVAIQRQATGRNTEWRERFLTDAGGALTGRGAVS